jgi:mercuric ion transport protein
MESTRLLRTGVVGSLVTAVCCFTPLLVWGLPALGLAAWLGWIDYVLLPVFAGFMILIAVALWRRWSA